MENDKTLFYIVAIVGIIAIVGLIVMVLNLNTGSTKYVASTTTNTDEAGQAVRGVTAPSLETVTYAGVLKMLNKCYVKTMPRPIHDMSCNDLCGSISGEKCVSVVTLTKTGESRDLNGQPFETFTTDSVGCNYIKPNNEDPFLTCTCCSAP